MPSDRVFLVETEEKLYGGVLLGMPHGGVHRVSDTIPGGLVETSNNLATVRTGEKEVRIVSSQRSSVMSRLAEVMEKVETVAKLAGARLSMNADILHGSLTFNQVCL